MKPVDHSRMPARPSETARSRATAGHVGWGPIRVLSCSVALTGLVLVGLAYQASHTHRLLVAIAKQDLRINELRTRIIHLDELLSMSTRMAAATGDPKWESRYLQFEPTLAQAISRAQLLVPKGLGSELVKGLRVASDQLMDMHHQALNAVRQGRLDEAQAIVNSSDYDAQKRAYAVGIGALDRELAELSESVIDKEQQEMLRTILLVAGTILTLLFGWLVVLRAMRRWADEMTAKNDQLARRTNEVVDLNKTLDQRVQERTKEWRESQLAAVKLMREAQEARQQLEHANRALLSEIAQRETAQQKLQQLASFPEQNPDPVIELEVDGHVTYLNPSARAVFPDLARGEGRYPLKEDLAAIARQLRDSQAPHATREVLIGFREYEEQVMLVDGSQRVRVYLRDITGRKRAERRLAVSHIVTRILAESGSLAQATPALVRSACEVLGWELGGMWIVDRAADVLRCLETWHAPTVDVAGFEAATRATTFAPGVGIPGHVWKQAVPMWLPDMATSPIVVQREEAGRHGLRSVLGFPIMHRAEVLGVMELFSLRQHEPDEMLLDVLISLGNQIGVFIEQRRLEQQRQEQAAALERNHAELLRRERVMQSLLEDLQASTSALEEKQKSLQAANRRLEELSRVKDEFVATVSHELRTPLTAIKEGISLLLDEALGSINEEQKDFLKTVDDNIERLTELISNMLDLSKIEAGRLRLFRKRIAVRRLIEDALSNYKAMAGQRTLVADVDNLPDIFADPNRILQVLGNLISNAIKFTNAGGQITITSRARNGHVALSVQDNGIGIAKDDLDKLFQRFSQVGEGQGRPRGTGLGLALCKELVELHRGRITVDSEPGHGSTFTLTLPSYTPEFTLQESFRELAELIKGDQETLALIALDAEPLFGTLVQALSEDGQRHERPTAVEQLEIVVDYIRKHLHRSDVVLSIEPRWVLILALADTAGVEAILGRLRGAIQKDMAAYAESADAIPLRFGVASHPADGQDVWALLGKATGMPSQALLSAGPDTEASHA